MLEWMITVHLRHKKKRLSDMNQTSAFYFVVQLTISWFPENRENG